MMGHKWNMVPLILRQANPCFESLVFEIVFLFGKNMASSEVLVVLQAQNVEEDAKLLRPY